MGSKTPQVPTGTTEMVEVIQPFLSELGRDISAPAIYLRAIIVSSLRDELASPTFIHAHERLKTSVTFTEGRGIWHDTPVMSVNSETNAKPVVGVVIVNHNLKDSLRETLLSVRKINYPNVKVVVSDNASSDGAQEMVRTEFPEVHLLAHKEEQGYARAASLGMKHLVDSCKYIFSTTNDVLFDPEIFNVLVDYAEQHPKSGVLGTKIYFFDKPDVLWHGGGVVNPWHGHTRHIGWLRKDHPRYSKVRECEFVTGCGYLLRCEVLKKVGFFREDFVFYSEDAELCYRFREAGYQVLYIPDAKMWHKTGTTLAKNRPVQLHYSTRNQLCLIQRHKAGHYPLILWVNILVVCPAKMLLFTLMFRRKNAVGIYRGIRDWRKGKLGWIR